MWLGSDELPVWRRLLACIAVVGALGAWNHQGPAPMVLFLAVAVPIVGMHLRFTWAQLAARAALCTGLLLGLGLEAKPFGAASATVALLALGRAGLRSRLTGQRYRSEVFVLVVAGSIAATLVALDVFDSTSYLAAHPRRAWLRGATLIALGAAVAGVYRARTWGVLALVVMVSLCTLMACLGAHRVGGYVLWDELAAERWLMLLTAITLATASIARSARRGAFPTLVDRLGPRSALTLLLLTGALGTLRQLI